MTPLSDEERAALTDLMAGRDYEQVDEMDEAIWRAATAYAYEQAAKICEAQGGLGPAWREMFANAIRARIKE